LAAFNLSQRVRCRLHSSRGRRGGGNQFAAVNLCLYVRSKLVRHFNQLATFNLGQFGWRFARIKRRSALNSNGR
jgi:hypothetical protein